MDIDKITFGAHIFLWIEQWTDEKLYLFEHVKSLGLDCLEIAVGDDVEYNPKKILAESEKSGTKIVISPGGVWPSEADIAHPDKECRSFGLQWHKDWIRAGAEAGAHAYTGALYAHPGRIVKDKQDNEEWKYAAENLCHLAEYASQYNMAIVLEPMSHFRTHLANTPGQVMKLINEAGHNNLYVLFDTYHMVTEIRDFASAISVMKNCLWGVHACENDRGVPGGGLVPWKDVFSALDKIDFCGYIILETYNSSLRNGAFAYSRGMFHHVCDDGDAFVKQGLAFIKQNMKQA